MEKPCVICVVRPICGIPCDEFIEYIRRSVIRRSGSTLSFESLAILERKGRIVLLDRDTTWQWVEAAVFWKGEDEESM
jgi:hypothetical protein